MSKNYVDKIVKHYESCLHKYGDSHLGVDWPKAEDVNKRYSVMLDIIRFDIVTTPNPSILDFGCGTAQLLNYINESGTKQLRYSGLDISEKYVELSRSKFPTNLFYCLDILEEAGHRLPNFDYVVMNGVFTEKRELSFEEMWEYLCKMVFKIFGISNRGIAFNVMSKAVEWERDDLFHLPTDLLIDFLTKNLTRNFIIRNDYGLYEYTVYIYK